MTCRSIYRSVVFALIAGVATLHLAACEELDNELTTAQDKIKRELNGQSIWERNNLPDDPPPSREPEGFYDIIQGAYRWVINEGREYRELAPTISEGDSISFRFDARIYSGTFGNSKIFYTNIEQQRQTVVGSNNQYDTTWWPVDPLEIKLGNDPGILKSLQKALVSCRAAGGDVVVRVENPKTHEMEDKTVTIVSDVVRVYLTSNIAFGDRRVNEVPAGSTLVYEISGINLIRKSE